MPSKKRRPKPTTQSTGERALEEVKAFFLAEPDLSQIVGQGLRQAFDEVIDGPRTGRYCVEQLEKTEKTYIGTKVEIVLRKELGLARGSSMDNEIAGHEVDTKFSLTGKWMIPQEAHDQICLLVQGSDAQHKFSLGLLRIQKEFLTKKGNRDGKRQISAHGKKMITWLVEDGEIPTNFMENLEANVRQEVLGESSGKRRVMALFRNVTNQLIPRSAIEHVAQQKDALRRAREAKNELAAKERYTVLCAAYDEDQIIEHGFSPDEGDWLSIPPNPNT